MDQDSFGGGCNNCGPIEICGHTTETCPKNKMRVEARENEASNAPVIFALDPESNVSHFENKDPSLVEVNEAGISVGGVLRTEGMVPCTAIFFLDKENNVGALGHFQPYTIRKQEFGGLQPSEVAHNEIEQILARMKARGAKPETTTALTLRSNVSRTKRHEANWSSVLLDALKANGVVAQDEIHEGDVKEARFDIQAGKITVSFYKRDKGDKEFSL